MKPAFFEDFNLGKIISTISEQWGEDIASFYELMPGSKEECLYRQGILQDLKNEILFDAVCAYIKGMETYSEIQDKKKKVTNREQKAIWHIREIYLYCINLEKLYEKLQTIPLQSEGFTSFRQYLEEYLHSAEYVTLSDTAKKVMDQLNSYRVRITYKDDRVVISEASNERTYDAFLAECFPEGKDNGELLMKSPYLNEPELVEFEQEVLSRYMKKHKNFLKEAEGFYAQNQNYINETFLEFKKDVVFYLSFLVFEKYMMNYGFDFTVPVTEEKTFKSQGLYDLALACVNVNEMKDVIRNDVFYGEGEQFFVLTGPNQGGKTTYARSLGQLVFFMKMGLDVPAMSANLPYFEDILTHFSVEESVDTGKGKLKEELTRLAPMMHESPDHSFVVINELFTTAANYDACIMGNRVLSHFLQKQNMGIYVTHLNELANPRDGVVSLRAMSDEAGVRSFKIERAQPEELAGAETQVEKYQLTYEQIMERLS